MIYSLGMRLFRNEEDALDFSQEVYLRAYDRLDSFRGDSKLSTWLYSLALNLGLNRLRRGKRLEFVSEGSADFPSIEALEGVDESNDPLATLTRAETELAVREEVEKLPDVYRIPLILFYFELMPYGEIAETLGLKEGTLKSYLHRARLLLRKKLAERGLESD